MPRSNRRTLNALQVAELRGELTARLATVGVQTRPEVALRVLALASDPTSTLKDFARIIRTDAGFSSRLLSIANSALFAQRLPVSTLDRACLLLGLDRLKSMTLGFHLASAASGRSGGEISRTVWGQSLLRACLASEVARHLAPKNVAEAFVIGLLLDCGLALMPRLAGEPFEALWTMGLSPDRLYAQELDTLRFTHVDVVAALAAKWKLPDILSVPLERHHAPPSWPLRHEPVHRLHAVAHVVGTLDLRVRTSAADGAVPVDREVQGAGTLALERTLGMTASEARKLVTKALEEYAATSGMFAEFASNLETEAGTAEALQCRALQALDNLASADLERELTQGQSRFTLGGARVEIERLQNGLVRAYLHDDQGQRLLMHVFHPVRDGIESLLAALGLTAHPGDDSPRLSALLKAG